MKKHIALLSVVAALFSFTGCIDEQLGQNQGDGVEAGAEFTINLNPATRTVNNGLSTEWVEGDNVNVFHAVAGTTDYIDDGAFEFTSGTMFKGKLAGEPALYQCNFRRCAGRLTGRSSALEKDGMEYV